MQYTISCVFFKDVCAHDPPCNILTCPLVCVCAAEAEDLSSRLQAGKQRVSELERTLSSVSTQQKQFEKVPDPLHYQLHLTKTTQFKFKEPCLLFSAA